MVGGFNTNIRYRGRTFHVQTEDGGESNAQIVTLLYEGGAIRSSRKQTYEEALGEKDRGSAVRALMEEQHRGVVQSLKSGALDEAIGLGSRASEGETSQPASALEFGEGHVSDGPLGDVILAHLDRQ